MTTMRLSLCTLFLLAFMGCSDSNPTAPSTPAPSTPTTQPPAPQDGPRPVINWDIEKHGECECVTVTPDIVTTNIVIYNEGGQYGASPGIKVKLPAWGTYKLIGAAGGYFSLPIEFTISPNPDASNASSTPTPSAGTPTQTAQKKVYGPYETGMVFVAGTSFEWWVSIPTGRYRVTVTTLDANHRAGYQPEQVHEELVPAINGIERTPTDDIATTEKQAVSVFEWAGPISRLSLRHIGAAQGAPNSVHGASILVESL